MEKGKVTNKKRVLKKNRVVLLCVFLVVLLLIIINVIYMIIQANKLKELNEKYVKVIDSYAKVVDNEVSKFIEGNDGTIPTWKDIENTVSELNSDVLCNTTINYDGSIYLDNCKVKELEYTADYKYGELLEEKETDDEIYTYHFDFIDNYLVSKIKRYSNYFTLVDTYKCKAQNCKVYDSNMSSKQVVIKDDKYYIYNFETKDLKELNLENEDYKDIKFLVKEDNLVGLLIKNSIDKSALYNLESNSLVTEFIYDGVSLWNEDGFDNYVALFYSDSKYNQNLKLISYTGEVLKENIDCIGLKDNTNEGRCNKHQHGILSREEVDKVIDRVLRDYPDLSFERLYMIKNAIETVGLPYLWGGGHATMENAIYIAEEIWNNQYCMVWADGSLRQLPGTSHPCGLDCSGFVRWVIYTVHGVDVFSTGVNIIGGRNPFVTLIDEKDKLPGDIVMDSDHVVIYLYTDDETGHNVYVHSALREYKVQISEYNKNVKFYRLNEWV